MKSKPALAIAVVFLACCANIFIFELVLKEDPGAGNLVAFLRFLFIAVLGFCTVGKFGTAKRTIPLKKYLVYVSFFWTTSVLNNFAFDFNIPMPLHMIFRSGSLMANMAMGVWLLKKRYPPLKYLAIFMISAGIGVCTLQSSGDVHAPRETHADAAEEERLKYIDWLWWCLGLCILSVSLLLNARLGVFQETLYAQYGKHPWEVIYYTHLIPLLLWIPMSSNLTQHIRIALDSPALNFVGLSIPRQVLYLVLFILTKTACTSAAYVLSSECSALAVTLTLTLRKFVSLVCSIYYFNNPFTFGHWIGTFLVFLGTLVFTEVPQKIVNCSYLKPKQDKKID